MKISKKLSTLQKLNLKQKNITYSMKHLKAFEGPNSFTRFKKNVLPDTNKNQYWHFTNNIIQFKYWSSSREELELLISTEKYNI